MTLALARIDDRLVHAQVIEGWLKAVGADTVVLVSDDVAADDIQKTMYSLTVPYGMPIECLSVAEAAKKLPAMMDSPSAVLLIMPSLSEAMALVGAGVKIKSLNVGGLHARSGKKFYTPTLSLDDKDIDVARRLEAAGVELETRVLPLAEREGLFEVVAREASKPSGAPPEKPTPERK
ncbi:MAG: PTS sugar transporter subunit IIB [Endomicrobiia bacterium]|nr:PTS sugar transporter subunit IIB [Endomicrobiia bacterium]